MKKIQAHLNTLSDFILKVLMVGDIDVTLYIYSYECRILSAFVFMCSK